MTNDNNMDVKRMGVIDARVNGGMTDDDKKDVQRMGMGVIDARVNGGNYATINHDTNSSQKNTPIAPTTTAKQPHVERTTEFADMYKANTTAPMTDEQRSKQQKRQRRQQTLAAIIDGISALGNVYFASRGAGANGTTNMSGAVSNKWTKYWDDAKADKKEYNKGLLAAQQLDYNTYLRRLERAEDKAERDAREANAEKWRQKEFDRDEKRYNEQIAYRDAKDVKMDERYENEQKEGTRRYNQNLGLQYQQHKDNMDLRKAQINATTARNLRGKQIGFVNGEGKQVSIYENVWRGSMQQVFDTLVNDLTPTDEKEKRHFKEEIKELDTPQKKEDFVKQNWHKSPGASQIMLTLSGIDPATMVSSIGEEGGGLGWGKKTDNKQTGTDW